MVRVISVFTALILASLSAGGEPTPTVAALYYPSKVRDKRVYLNGKYEQTFVVTAVDEKDGAKIVTVSEVFKTGPQPQQYVTVTVSDKGVYRIGDYAGKYDTPMCVIKLPHVAGETWKANLPGQSPLARYLGAFTTGPVEQVEVPAGKFKAIRIDYDGPKDGRQFRQTFWFAPDVGMVKTVVGEGRAEVVLKSYERGK